MKKQEGFIIKYIFWFFIIILILSYLGFNLEELMSSEVVVKNFEYIKQVFFNFWDTILQPFYEWFINIFGNQIFKIISLI